MIKKEIDVVIIDDDSHAIDALRDEINSHFRELNIVAVAMNIPEAVDVIKKYHPEIIFLDIKLQDGLGFDVLNAVKDQLGHVIFTTAYSNYALKAIKYSALDYLLKPIYRLDLYNALNKYAQTVNKEHQKYLQFKALEDNLSSKLPHRIAIKTNEGLDIVDVNSIMFCKSESNYTYLYTSVGQRYLMSKTLKKVEDFLDLNQFFRAHQSYLVNLNYVEKFIKESNKLMLKNGEEILVSFRKKNSLMEKLSFLGMD